MTNESGDPISAALAIKEALRASKARLYENRRLLEEDLGGCILRSGQSLAASRALLDRVCREAGKHLRAGGSLLLVQSSICGVDETCERLRTAGLHADVRARIPGALGPVMRKRAPMLRSRGLLARQLPVPRHRVQP